MQPASKPETIDDYIAAYEGDDAARLTAMRQTIAKAAPKATEAISYGMPTFKLEGNLVHFGAAKKHIGFYPAPSGIEAFVDELKDFTTSKGAIQLPNDKPLPLKLVAAITKFRVAENLEKAGVKKG